MKIISISVVVVLLINGIFLSGCIDISKEENTNSQEAAGIEIAVNSLESPIRKYFTTQKILWTLDDYSIQYRHSPPHKGFGGLTEKITSYGGFVQIMVIFTSEIHTKKFNNEIRNYSVVNDFGYSINDINASLEFFSRPNVEAANHGWNHTENLNDANLSFAYTIINYTFWNWKNNYNITPHFFLGPGTSGNYNVTVALKRFGEKYWTVYGENFRWYNKNLFPNSSRDSPAVEYLEKPSYVVEFDPLFGCTWGNPCRNLNEAKDLFNNSSHGKEVLLIRGHPSFLNGTNQRATENLTFWEEWIDWIYQTHEFINMNHTEVVQYNIDRYNFKILKNSEKNYTLDLTKCKFNHDILFSNPNNTDANWTIYDEYTNYIGMVEGDTFVRLARGLKYYIVLNDVFNGD